MRQPELHRSLGHSDLAEAAQAKDAAAALVLRTLDAMKGVPVEEVTAEKLCEAVTQSDAEPCVREEAAELIVKGAAHKPMPKWAECHVKQLLEEHSNARLSKQLGDGTPLSDAIHDTSNRLMGIHSLGEPPLLAFEPGWDQSQQLKLASTGVPFLDRFLGGGQASGEVYGLLGPYGSCKTTLAFQLAIEAARGFAASHVEGAKPKVAVIVNYETSKAESYLLALCYAAQVHRSRLQNMKGVEDLSTSDDLQPYELKKRQRLGRAGIQDFPGEQERIAQAVSWLKKHLCVMEMTGVRGSDGINGIASRLQTALRASNAECGLIVIDYIGAMGHRVLGGLSDTMAGQTGELRQVIAGTPLTAKTKLAMKFDCPVWLLHQLCGKANGLSPSAKLDHTDAAESRGFAENLDFCFVVGNPNSDQLARLQCTKHRRQPTRDSAVIRIRGEWATVESAEDRMFDPVRRRIAPINHLQRVGRDVHLR